ncbi:TWiK family of potassium channels protein 18-like [Centruroides sculpturatus]|uniref:TWiK family of potassium channels protein 18-like n=1 Tax=Centruroides sculpturatus TaxID=218467 RepID=UPI000C6EDC87|nr:TWiK family of potassium channels protein 18-like [Centruroides sculpturatus]
MSSTKENSKNSRNQYHAVAPLEDGLENKNKEIKSDKDKDKKTKQKIKKKKTKNKKWVLLKLTGFTLIYFSYALIGAYIFSLLESPEHEEFHYHVNRWKNDTSILLATDLRKIVPYEAEWAKTVYRHLHIFEKDLLKAYLEGYRRSDVNSVWSLANSFYFSVIVMTTTGYENVTIRSTWGKLFLLLYLIVGLPVTITWLFFVGYYLAELWLWLLSGKCFFRRKRKVHPITNTLAKQYIIDRPATRPSSSAILTSPKELEKHFDSKNIKFHKRRLFKHKACI